MSTSAPLLGSMRFGDWGARLSPAAVADLLDAALDAGIDTLDLADIYGGHTTNALVGAALALRPDLRARFGLVAKIGIVTLADLAYILGSSQTLGGDGMTWSAVGHTLAAVCEPRGGRYTTRYGGSR